MIDINYHLLTESGQAPPPDYYQSFIQLATFGVYPAEFAQRIAARAGLRNRIAHEYDDIDPQKLFEAVRQAVGDLPEYGALTVARAARARLLNRFTLARL